MTAEKNKVRFDLVQALCEAGRLVQNVSKGDEVMIHSSGFDRNRKPCSVEILDQPSDMKVKPGKISGTLDVSWNKVNHSRGCFLATKTRRHKGIIMKFLFLRTFAVVFLPPRQEDTKVSQTERH